MFGLGFDKVLPLFVLDKHAPVRPFHVLTSGSDYFTEKHVTPRGPGDPGKGGCLPLVIDRVTRPTKKGKHWILEKKMEKLDFHFVTLDQEIRKRFSTHIFATSDFVHQRMYY